MLLGEPARSQGDLNFSLGGFPIRVTPGFWLACLLLGLGPTDNGNPQSVPPWILAVFLSILIHELGHAFAFRLYGIPAHVVLYHFGGLAVPHGGAAPWGSRDPRGRMLIASAGPAAQLVAAGILMAILAWSGREVPLGGFVADYLPLPQAGVQVQPLSLQLFVVFFLYASIYWALLNLLPVYPLDGGQIAREAFLMFGRGDAIRLSLILSVVTAALMAIWGFQQGDHYLGILFGMLAYSSYTALQTYTGYGGGFGRGW